jgi:pyridoxal phosphate enzyme (YggS family)
MPEIFFEDRVNEIQQNLEKVQSKIKFAAERVGRNSDSVKLVAVTKRQSAEVIRAAIETGIRCFGENYAEEAAEKITAVDPKHELEWHMIGHIQSRKASTVCDHFGMVHSVDRMKIARYLDRYAGKKGLILPVLLEVNLSGEESKFGWTAHNEKQWPDLLHQFKLIGDLENIHISGLMTMPPLFVDPGATRPIYQKLKGLQRYLGENLPSLVWDELSIGTSFDYEIAIEEGATIVRIGSEIFGSRDED